MSEKKYIRFIDSAYNTLFHIPDGGRIKVTRKRQEKKKIESSHSMTLF